jgi:hypothetical protein
MKDAKGHGSNSRGGSAAHQSGVDKIAGPEHMVPVASLTPRPENTEMLAKLDRDEDDREEAFKAAYPGEAYTRDGPKEQIADYASKMRSGIKFVPLAVNKDGSIENGERRWRAAQRAGLKTINVRTLK